MSLYPYHLSIEQLSVVDAAIEKYKHSMQLEPNKIALREELSQCLSKGEISILERYYTYNPEE